MTEATGQGPLSRFRVLDLTRVRAGPTAVRQLADWGADVIKLETPPSPNEGEGMGGPRHGPDFQNIHRNKRGLTLNLKSAEGMEVFRRLIAQVDVVVENYRPDVKHRLGIDYDSLKEINPGLVYGSISGFGQDGPWAKRPAFDAIAQAEGGLMHLTGDKDGEETMFGSVVIDYSTGANAAMGVMAALHARERTGRGQVVDVPLLDTAMSFLMTAVAEHHRDGNVMGRMGNRDRYSAPANTFRTRDGQRVHLMSAGVKHFNALVKILGEEEILQDPRFATPPDRLANADLVDETVAGWFLRHDRDWLLEQLVAAEIPCARMATVADVVDNPQVKHRGQIIDIKHPTLGVVKTQGNPIRLTDTPVETYRDVPTLGQHTDEILGGWLDMDESEIATLRDDGVV